jgi:AcrR family transcriptional regulator
MAPTVKSDTYHHGDLRSALIAAGTEIVERDGFEALTVRAAARVVGVSHGAPARHFADLRSFVAAIAAAGFTRLGETLAEPRNDDPVAELRAVGDSYVHFALTHPNLYRVLFHPLLAERSEQSELAATSMAAFDQLRRRIERAMAAGAIRQGDVTASAVALWSSVHGVCILLLDGQISDKGLDLEPLAVANMVLDATYLGLRPDDTATASRPAQRRRNTRQSH